MKTAIQKYIIAPAVALGLFACSENPTDPQISANPIPAKISTVFQETYTFEKDTHDEAWETIAWEAADYGVATEINYSVAISKTEDFEVARELGTTNGRELEVTAGTISNDMIALGYVALQPGTVYLRVTSSLKDNTNHDVDSEVTTLTVTPLAPLYPVEINIIGKLFGDWNHANAVPTTAKGNGVFEHEAFYDDGFKMYDPTLGGDWSIPHYAYSDFPAENVSKYLEADGDGNFSVVEGAEHDYRMTVDFKNETITMLKVGLLKVGSANGWNGGEDGDNQSLTEVSPNVWELEVELQKDESFKFVPVFTDWSVSYGYNEFTTLDADFVEDGGNIKYTAETATKTIVVDMSAMTLLYK